MSTPQGNEESPREYKYGIRTVMELFDIGPGVALTALSIALVVIVVGLVIFIRSAPPTRLTITSGPEDSSFNRTAKKYAKILEKNGIQVTVLNSKGSLENLHRLQDAKSNVDIALVQGGITEKEDNLDHLYSLGAISYQPLMVFYRGKPIELLSELAGKSIAIGPEGSGTRKFALRLLAANGITEKDPGQTKLLDTDADHAADELEAHKLDAAFVMGENIGIEDLRRLLRSKEIHLMNFKQAAGYNRKLDYLNVLELPEGVLDFGKNIPEKNVTLLGPMLELIATDKLHPALSDLILDAATQIHSRPGIYQKRGEFPIAIEHAIPMSEDATRFYKSGKSLFYRYLPFWLASLVSRIVTVLLPIALFLIPTLRSIPTFFRWRTQIKIRRRYRDLLTIEEKFKNETDPARLALLRRNFDRIDNEMSKMRVRAAFADQFYSLRGHIDYVRGVMSKKLV